MHAFDRRSAGLGLALSGVPLGVPVAAQQPSTILERRKLVARVYSAQEVEIISATAGWLHEPLNAELAIGYLYDNGPSLSTASNDTLSQMGIANGQHRPVALGNLAGRLRADALNTKILPGEGEWVCLVTAKNAAADGLVTGLLLLDEIWSQTGWPFRSLKVGGEFRVHVPSREHVIVTTSGNRRHIDTAADLANRLFAETRKRISPAAFVRRDSRWQRADA